MMDNKAYVKRGVFQTVVLPLNYCAVKLAPNQYKLQQSCHTDPITLPLLGWKQTCYKIPRVQFLCRV